MKKSGVIVLSVILILLALTGVLFGAVFCLRSQTVTFLGNTAIEISKDDIIKTAGLKKGKSIFLLDKEKATQNLENTYANLKVVQIKTTSVTKIEIIVRARVEMFYVEHENHYYFLDEDLKVLRLEEVTLDNPETELENEYELNKPQITNLSSELKNLTSNTKVCNFVGDEQTRSITSKLYNAVITTVTDPETDEYYTREDMKNQLVNISFENHKTFDKLIIKTKHGVTLDIENPNENLQNKINWCFSTINEFISRSDDPEYKDKEKSGTIKIYYELDGSQKCVYIPSPSAEPEPEPEPEPTPVE